MGLLSLLDQYLSNRAIQGDAKMKKRKKKLQGE